MQTPVDYPLIDHAHSAQFTVDELAFAALLDRTDTLVPTTDEANVLTTAIAPEISESPATLDHQLPKPFRILAQSLLARGGSAINDDRNGAVDGVFSRWSRALR